MISVLVVITPVAVVTMVVSRLHVTPHLQKERSTEVKAPQPCSTCRPPPFQKRLRRGASMLRKAPAATTAAAKLL